ncbi:MAG: hypothetical protein AAGK32_13885, partial [Actinomycetota bacterium]
VGERPEDAPGGAASDHDLVDDDFVMDATDTGHTRLTGEIRDPAHLHGVLNQLTSLAIEIVSVTTTTNERQP